VRLGRTSVDTRDLRQAQGPGGAGRLGTRAPEETVRVAVAGPRRPHRPSLAAAAPAKAYARLDVMFNTFFL
jgi:hypothetical protein